MNSKNIKVVDEHNIDRNANIIFAFDLDGSEYVSYWIERDEENSNIFVSKIIKNLDNTYNMLDVEDTAEKTRLNEIVKALITNAVESQADKLVGNSVTLADGKVVKFMPVNFNKEQRFNIPKTYITTVKKEVIRVAEKYYFVEVVLEQPKVVEDIFPTVTPVVEPVKDVLPEIPVQPTPAVVENPTVSTPVVEMPVVSEAPSVLEPAKVETPTQVIPTEVPVVEPSPVVVEPVSVAPAAPVETPTVIEPTVILPTPEPAAVVTPEVEQPLVFNASKETNLNAALGEVASTTTIPVENIQPVREFGVDAPVQAAPVVPETPVAVPTAQPEVQVQQPLETKKAGFADSKFFMVVAIAFFLASCVFLGYEVFSYFQLTK